MIGKAKSDLYCNRAEQCGQDTVSSLGEKSLFHSSTLRSGIESILLDGFISDICLNDFDLNVIAYTERLLVYPVGVLFCLADQAAHLQEKPSLVLPRCPVHNGG